MSLSFKIGGSERLRITSAPHAALRAGAAAAPGRADWAPYSASSAKLRRKPAGLRTNVLIALGAALFTITSILLKDAGGTADRVAAQVVTGIGFLGAGAILRNRGGVHGMTTAATIWVNAAIGMAAGAGASAWRSPRRSSRSSSC